MESKNQQVDGNQSGSAESIQTEKHPLAAGKDTGFIELYAKSVLIARTALQPLAYSDHEEENRQLSLFFRSLGLSEKLSELEQEVGMYQPQDKTETLDKFFSSCDDDITINFMCDAARLHGARYKFKGPFADYLQGKVKLPPEQWAAAEKLCRDIASGRKLGAPEKYAPVPEVFVRWFGQEAFSSACGVPDTNAQCLVIDLSGGPDASAYPLRSTGDEPDLSEEVCRTTELWLRRIPAGTFSMGSPGNERGRFSDENSHKVTLSGYWIGHYEVTQGQWKSVMGDDPSKFKADNHPVEQIRWEDARKFCDKLNEKCAGKLPQGYRFDLPTEAQWEYACRAGTTTALNSSAGLTSEEDFCRNLDEVGWYAGNSNRSAHPVGEKRPNEWGLYDMHGNVWEWCRDWSGPYEGDAADPAGPAAGLFRVGRGGGWGSSARSCRSACRHDFTPGLRFPYLGFRLALVPVR